MAGANGFAAASFAGPARTAGYAPSAVGYPLWYIGQAKLFTLADVEVMRRDPQVDFGLRMLRAPLHTVTWKVTGDADVAAFVDEQLKRIWQKDLTKILRMFEYGYAGAEVLYKQEEGCWEFDTLKDFYPRDVVPLVTSTVLDQKGRMDPNASKLCGVRVKNVGTTGHIDLAMPRAFWIANEAEFGSLYGRSRLVGAWEPWIEKCGKHGAKDIRRLWYVKNAYRGGKMRHPAGFLEGPDGAQVSCQDYAREIGEKVETGGIMVLPNARDEQGNYLWDYEEPQVNGELRDVREYPKDLDDEILKGLGVPPELVRASETGSGFSGRMVPAEVFYTSEDEIADNVIATVDRQILRPLVAINFGSGRKYQIEPESLAKKMQEQAKPPAPNPFADLLDLDRPQSQRFSHVAIPDDLRRRVRELARKKHPRKG